MKNEKIFRFFTQPLHDQKHKALVILLLYGVWISAHLFVFWNSDGDDFSSIYIAARLMAEGKEDHVYSHHPVYFQKVDDPVWTQTVAEAGFKGIPHPYVHIPLLAKSLSPLTRIFSFPVLNRFVLILSLSSIFGLVLVTIQVFCHQVQNLFQFICILVIISLSEPFRYSIFLSQTHPIFLFLILAAVLGSARNKSIVAGVLLALATIVKITPAVLGVYWVFTGRRKEAFSFFLSSGLLFGFSYASAGSELHSEFYEALSRNSNQVVMAFNNQSLVSWGQRFYLESIYHGKLRYVDWTMYPLLPSIKIVNLMVMGIVLSSVIGAFWWRKAQALDFDRWGIPAILILFTVFSPIAWSHYFVVLLVPLLVLADQAMQKQSKALFWLILMVVLLNCRPIAVDAIKFGVASANTMNFGTLALVHSHLLGALLTLILVLYFCWRFPKVSQNQTAIEET